MIKYLGSKRRLVPVLASLAARAGARTAADLFTGTTRVAQAFKRQGIHVTAVDLARYSEVLARCYVATDAGAVDVAELDRSLVALDLLRGVDGYVTETFCREARYFQPHNGRRIDAIRAAIATHHAGSPLEPLLLTSLLEAADRVDSTTGLQMAYLKQWAPRSHNRLALRRPLLLAGTGTAVRGDVVDVVGALPPVDLAYLDPPYNQHRYFTNYHVWETLVRGDAPEAFGVARKRVDARDPSTRTRFDRRADMPGALAEVIERVRASVIVVSFSNEGWVALDDLRAMCEVRGAAEVLSFDSPRYVGARIGIHNPKGERVGTVSHTRNIEHVVIAGGRADVRRLVEEPFAALVG